MSNSDHCQVQVDLRIFDLAVVQTAAYNLLATYEFHLEPPDGNFLSVTILPFGGSGTLPPHISDLYQQELTRVAMERQAHADHRHLRTWFAVAAMATDTPADTVLAELQTDLDAMPADARTYEVSRETLAESLRYYVSEECPVQVLLRAISRLHDVSESVLEGYHPGGRLSLIVRLAPGVNLSWWEDRFRSLLAACTDGGLPALYPPAFALDELLA